MSGNQAWVTWASTDHEGLKAVLLARSLKLSITTRQRVIIISDEVSLDIRKLLHKEFDWCIRGSDAFEAEWTKGSFSNAAKLLCWQLQNIHKFVFLDHNCMVLKNADEIFQTTGFGFIQHGDNTWKSFVLVSTSKDKKTQKLIQTFTNGKLWDVSSNMLLENKYYAPIHFQKGSVVTGQDVKIACFVDIHPLDLLLKYDETLISKMGEFDSNLMKWCLELLPESALRKRNLLQENMTNVLPKLLKLSPEEELDRMKRNEFIDSKLLTEMKNSIAIVGMAFRLPGANTIEEFWDLLIKGDEAIIKAPPSRWTADKTISNGEKYKKTEAGFLNCPIDEIDRKFFGINPAELEYLDPQQRLALHVVCEGIEDSGISPTELKKKLTGVFGGWWRVDYKDMLQCTGIGEDEFFRSYMGNSLGTLTGRISHCLELTGPSVPTESGCSTSIVGVNMACSSLQEEKCDIALAVGVNLLLHPFTTDVMSAVIAEDGRCKTFDAGADGFGRAEGCAVLILKRLADAVKDEDKIWALIRGSAVVQEGPSGSLGTPTVECESLAMSLALERSGVEAKEVSYIETHGTGTPVGDPLEVAAVAKVYAKNRKDILTIGSVKTNIGHTESVSGISGIVKTVLSLQNEIIPPHRNMNKLNPDIHLESIPAQIPLKAVKWPKISGKPRYAGVSSFGITGTDAHLILQETPDILQSHVENTNFSIQNKILTISAKDATGLTDYISKYDSYLSNTNEDISHIEYTSHVGREHYSNRFTLIGKNKKEILQKLQSNKFDSTNTNSVPEKICFLFTGQGSQYVGMAKELYESSLVFKSHFDLCERKLVEKYGFSIKTSIWPSNETSSLNQTLISQTSIFCIEYCLLQLWDSWGVKPDYVLGHSLGEFSAAVAKGILDFNSALDLVVIRSKLINSLPTGKMLVIKESLQEIIKLLKCYFQNDCNLDIAAVNSPEQTVLAGDSETIVKFSEFCKNNKIKTHVLDASHAFHSRHMDAMLEEYRQAATKILAQIIKPSNTSVTYISGMEGKIMEPQEMNSDYWVRHTREKVNFLEASKVAFQTGCNFFLEIGPQPVLSAMILVNSDAMEFSSATVIPSIRKNENNWDTMLSSLSKLYVNGVDINWENYHRYSPSNSRRKVKLPSYPFQMKSYWMEKDCSEPSQIHPLIGCSVPNPSSLKLFKVKVNVKELPFLKDHIVGNKIIFPGACFLEMCLAAGHAALQGAESLEGGLAYIPPSTPITITDFKIQAPLRINEEGNTEMQVVVKTDDASGETNITIYSKLILDKETYNWIPHVTAKFSPFASKWDSQQEFLSDSLENIQARCSETVAPEDVSYSKLEKFGMKFGPTFQSIEKVWKDQDSKEICFQVKLTEDPTHYVCHPIVTDSLFQALLISVNKNTGNLHVPISISKFLWNGTPPTAKCYVYCKALGENDRKNKEQEALLMNSDGELVAVMIGAELMQTTVSQVMSMLDAQRMPHLSMYEDVWREKLGPMERRINGLPSVVETFKGANDLGLGILPQEEKQIYEQTETLAGFYMIKALQHLHFTNFVKLGETFEISHVASSLKIKNSLWGLFDYIFVELAKDGFFELVNDQVRKFRFIKELPHSNVVDGCIKTFTQETKELKTVDVFCLSQTGEKLGELLTGSMSGLSILFPDDANKVGPAELYYAKSQAHLSGGKLCQYLITNALDNIKKKRGPNKLVIRLLEVGAGTGSFTSVLLPHLIEDGAANCEYTYTDISPVFFQNGEKIFENSKIKLHLKLLDIEQDPIQQGFIPNHYDWIFANEVIHATRDIKESMSNIRTLLAPGGQVFLTELLQPYRMLNLFVGVLDGFWRFQDKDLRPHNCEMDFKRWETVLKSLNFKDITSVPFCNSNFGMINATISNTCNPSIVAQKITLQKSWIVFSNGGYTSNALVQKLRNQGKNIILAKSTYQKIFENPLNLETIEVSPETPADILKIFESVPHKEDLEGVLFLWGIQNDEEITLNDSIPDYKYPSICQPFLSLCKILTSTDLSSLKVFIVTNGLLHVENDHLRVPTSNPIIAMAKALQNETPHLKVRCIDLDPLQKKHQNEECFAELFTDDVEIYVAYRNNIRLVPRMVSLKIANTALKLPRSEQYQLILPPTNTFDDLRFGPMDKCQLKDGEVEVKIKAYSLNFRDVLSVLKPDPRFDVINTVGLDYAGVITKVSSNVNKLKVGDAVCGINMNGLAMPSHISVDENMLSPMAHDTTFCEAATLPAVAATVIVCLIDVAKITKNDTVLIHTATGGVGLCAIQVAQSVGCKIVATAGSDRKRNYLKRLGITHIFNSRTTDYKSEIRKALNGEGVDVVLNSLTSPGFIDASLEVCNQNARFIEMSKLNIWSDEQVSKVRPDVKYSIVDLSSYTDEETRKLMKQLPQMRQDYLIKPLPYVRFDATEVRSALIYMQKAKHIGKVVCVMPNELSLTATLGGEGHECPLFNDRSSYMITGGLGGIGFEVAKWMLKEGAQQILLVGRSNPKDSIREEITRLNEQGADLRVLHSDVGDYSKCKLLLEKIKDKENGLFPLRGIMHAAGVISDGLFSSQSWESYETAFNAKVRGSLNLHYLTLDDNLEFFVMFSSIAALFGSVGQSNHSAANYFLDSLTHYRNSIGLPSSTINWGQWGQVGVAANLELIAFRPFSVLQGMSALKKSMKGHKPQVAAFEGDLQAWSMAFPWGKRYFEELKIKKSTNVQVITVNKDAFWKQYDCAATHEEKLSLLKDAISNLLKSTLKMDSDEVIEEDTSFQELGMDSLMMIEMKNSIQMILGDRVKVTVAAVKDCKKVGQLASRLLELISGEVELQSPSREELIQLIKEDSTLSSVSSPKESPAQSVNEIKSVLLTGVTGNLGPFVLQEILKQNQNINKIYCLMRDHKLLSPLDRLKEVLKDRKLKSTVDMSKIECISGDVTHPNFGMSKEDYENLSHNVDGIIHLAGKSVWNEFYVKTDKSNHTRTINVTGIKNIIQFACDGKTKHIFNASSLTATTRVNSQGRLNEEWPIDGEFDEIQNIAFPISNFVCDRLLAQALESGIPVKSVRLPTLGGHSETGGNISIIENRTMMRLISYMYLGVMPARNIPINIIPVDIIAKVAVKIFLSNETGCEVFNLTNPNVRDELEFDDVAKELFGYQVESVEMEEFVNKVNSIEKDGTKALIDIADIVKNSIKFQESIKEFEENIPQPVSDWIAGNKDVFLSEKLAKLIPEYPDCLRDSWSIIKEDLQLAKDSGFFAKVGLN